MMNNYLTRVDAEAQIRNLKARLWTSESENRQYRIDNSNLKAELKEARSAGFAVLRQLVTASEERDAARKAAHRADDARNNLETRLWNAIERTRLANLPNNIVGAVADLRRDADWLAITRLARDKLKQDCAAKDVTIADLMDERSRLTHALDEANDERRQALRLADDMREAVKRLEASLAVARSHLAHL